MSTKKTKAAEGLPIVVEAVLVGTKPLLMHADRLANPFDVYTHEMQKITKKKKKTEDDHSAIAQIEWHAGLHYDATDGPIIPCEMVEALLVAAAKRRKLGSAFKAAVMVLDEHFRLEYDGPRDRNALWEDERFRDQRMAVNRGTSRVFRTRPKFNQWKVKVKVNIIPESGVEVEDVQSAFEVGGELCGFGDYRPRFGTFRVESFKQLS